MPFEIGQILFGHGERDIDRIDLVDDYQRRAVIHPHQIAFVDEQAADTAIHR